MAIQFDCPSCGRRLKAPDTTAGKTAKCPYCQTHLQVPEPVYEAEELAPEPAAPEPGVFAIEAPAETPAAENRRPCPMCGEMIKATAVKCRFCGEIFDETLRRADKKRRGHTDYDSDLTAGEWVVAILCSGIGCICGIVWMIQGKPKGTKMFVVSLISSAVWTAINLLLEAVKHDL